MASPAGFEGFRSRRAAHKWLREQGYKISEKKFYQDSDRGLLVLESDGAVTIAAVENYISAIKLKRLAADSREAVTLLEMKTKEEVKILELKRERLEREAEREKGEWMTRRGFEREIVARSVIFKNGLENFCWRNIPEIVGMTDGDSAKVNDAVDFALEQVALLLDEYSSMEKFTVVVNEDGSGSLSFVPGKRCEPMIFRHKKRDSESLLSPCFYLW